MDDRARVLAAVRPVLRAAAEAKFLLGGSAPASIARSSISHLLAVVGDLRDVWDEVNELEERPAWNWPEWDDSVKSMSEQELGVDHG